MVKITKVFTMVHRIFFFLLVVASGISSLTRNRNWAPSIGIEDS